MKTRVILAATALLALGFQIQEKAPMNDSIQKEHLRADLFFLAGDGMLGRLTNTPTNSLAAEFIKSRFERMELKSGVQDGSFYQRHNLITSTLGSENMLELLGTDGGNLRLRPGQDYYPLNFSASGRARGRLVYAGFGIMTKELNHDDYRGEDVRGSVALMIDHEPGERDPESPFDGLVASEVSSPLRKTLFAQERGAVGVLFVRDVHNHPELDNFDASARNYWPSQPPRIERFTLATWVEKVRIPAAQISPALAEKLIRPTNRSLEDLGKSAEATGGLAPMLVPGAQIEWTTTVDRHMVPDRNVVGMIEGSDSRLKDECVMVCAHFDHNGSDGVQIFNGADDDGSGTVGLIEIAQAYSLAAATGQRPRRTVLFAAWNSEERGLLGAWAYTEKPLWPLEKTVAVLNMDMIGRNEEVPVGGGPRFRGLEVQTAESNNDAVNVIGTTRSADLKAAVEKANRGFGLNLKFRYDNNISNLMRRSDHWPFLQRGVAALWFHTGLHPDYHTMYDRPEKINYVKMERIVRMIHQMSWNLANQDSRPKLDPRK